jgi:hypothetical protein
MFVRTGHFVLCDHIRVTYHGKRGGAAVAVTHI